ncbi:LutC/YkgG family protein [Streptomyces sp. BE303]|uniref:LutC/YkgG family protein n=1 Tax=Streptomyces sp. BE303 TaxID=3002528 RepID=UPI002E785081|nr:lactate utilization protein C [Streptomyces sp. BE303]MED7949000.1 lactate utilization protein C [Streptomyces sp. BE303]
MNTRDTILARIRAAVADAPEPAPLTRAYAFSHTSDDPGWIVDLLAENLTEYRAIVHRCPTTDLPQFLADLLERRGARTVVAATGLPGAWLSRVPPTILGDSDAPARTPALLERVDTVITGCALAIAETGTIVLDGGPGQGHRTLTLVPDHHICVIGAHQIVASLPQALPLLTPTRPLTWISGPSATSDIELDRVEGVHGPRTLEVVITDQAA